MASQGRPMQPRSIEIMNRMKENLSGAPMEFELTEYEQNNFIRFSQRCRTVGRHIGITKVSVCRDKDDPSKAIVSVVENA